MNTLNLENINKQAPYKVTIDRAYPHLFYFHTDYDVDYEICIKANDNKLLVIVFSSGGLTPTNTESNM